MARKPYVVIDAEILSSSIWSEDSDTRLVWFTLLILCDTEGYVGAAVPGIARAAGVPLDATIAALEKFQQPDPHSRTQTEEGRRIRVVERGFQVLNFQEHLDRMSAERAKARDRVRKHRERKRQRLDGNVTVHPGSRDVGSREKGEETNGTTDNGLSSTVVEPATKARLASLFDLYKRMLGKTPGYLLDRKRKAKLEARISEGRTDEDFELAFRGCATSDFHREGDHTDLELICRDAPHFDRFMAMGRNVGKPVLSEKTRRSRDAIQSYVLRAKAMEEADDKS